MVNFYFKEVGQGDSIIIEWIVNSVKHIGIIDCNTDNNRNAVIEHIRINNVKTIDFIILSHPHTDHFSGFNGLLDYCIKENINIKRFLHTCQSNPYYIKSAVKGMVASKELGTLFQRISTLFKDESGIIDDIGYISRDTSPIYLSEGIILEFLSPTAREYQDYEAKIYKNENFLGVNNANANLLSTIIRIGTPNNYVLLTSDAVNESFYRIIRKEGNRVTGNLLMMQIPHHGSENNYCKAFWKGLVIVSKSPAIISVGRNKYGHPSPKVIAWFLELDTCICSTNNFNNFNSQGTLDEEDMLSFAGLSSNSSLTSTQQGNNLQGDKFFSLKNDLLEHTYLCN